MSYISQVADHLLARSGRLSIIPSEVYTKIADWEKRGIPLEVVLCAVDDLKGSQATTDELNDVVLGKFRGWLGSRDRD